MDDIEKKDKEVRPPITYTRWCIPPGFYPVGDDDIVITDGVDTMTWFPGWGYVMD
jgi:hypothetical protein